MVTLGSDNPFPSLLIVEGFEPSAPASGRQRLYIDSTSHLLKLTNSSGVESNVGSPMTLTEYTLGADVTMTSVNTLYDGPSGTPAAGTYDIFARLCLLNPGTAAEIFTLRLYQASTVIDEVELSGYVQSAGICVHGVLAARATLTGSEVLKASAMSAAVANCVIKRDPATHSSGVHRASLLRIQKVA